MRYVVLDKVQEGDILGRTLLDDTGRILLRDGAELNAKKLDKIRSMDYGGLYIDDEISKDIQLEDFVPYELKQTAFRALATRNVDLCVAVAKKLVDELYSKTSLAINIIDVKNINSYTINHSINVCINSIILAIAAGMNKTGLEHLAVAALLADIGKFEISNDIWHKPGKLTDMEMQQVMEHPKIAFEKLKAYPSISPISRNAILFSHENLDGSGYYGRMDDEIRIIPRIIHLMDSFDALTSVRKHRPAYSIKESTELLMASSNKYDEALLRLMSRLFPIYPMGMTVTLSNGEKAVIRSNEHNAIRPIIRLMNTGDLIDLSDNQLYRNVVIQDMDR